MGSNKKPRNYMLASGLMRFSRTAVFHKRGKYKFAKEGQRKPAAAALGPKIVEKTIGGDKNGGKRMVQVKRMRKSYETQEVPRRIKTSKGRFGEHKRNLRSSITPGTILILVAGAHKGKHVVFLKQLDTGLLLVTGPYRLNGCPVRRVNQRYVMATKTKIDLEGLQIPERVNDDYFKRKHVKRTKPAEGDIFEAKKEKYIVNEERKEDQVAIDKQIIAAIKKREDKKLMIGYLKSNFSLKNHQYPHKMVF